MMLLMNADRKAACTTAKINHVPTLSEALRTLFNTDTKTTNVEPDQKYTTDSKSCLLTPHGHCRASGKIIYYMYTMLGMFQKPGPTEK